MLEVGGVLTHSLSIDDDFLLFSYGLRQANGQLFLALSGADFAGPAAAGSKNTQAAADYVQAIWDAGGTPGILPLFSALEDALRSSSDAYIDAVGGLSLDAAAAPAALAANDQRDFADSLMSCPGFEGESRLPVEGSCSWAKVSGRRYNQSGHDGYSGFDRDSSALQLGAQAEIKPGWLMGIAAAYEQSSYDDDTGRVDTDGEAVRAGITLRREDGPLQLVGAFSGGWGWYDSDRQINIDGFRGRADSSPQVVNAGARLHAAYHFELGGAYLKPAIDLDAIYTRAKGYSESGADALSLKVEDESQWSLIATPSIELGTRIDLKPKQSLRAYSRVGVSFANQDDWHSSARFRDAPAGSGALSSVIPIDNVTGRVDVGLEFAASERLKLRLQYDGAFSENTNSHTGSLRASWAF